MEDFFEKFFSRHTQENERAEEIKKLEEYCFEIGVSADTVQEAYLDALSSVCGSDNELRDKIKKFLDSGGAANDVADLIETMRRHEKMEKESMQILREVIASSNLSEKDKGYFMNLIKARRGRVRIIDNSVSTEQNGTPGEDGVYRYRYKETIDSRGDSLTTVAHKVETSLENNTNPHIELLDSDVEK